MSITDLSPSVPGISSIPGATSQRHLALDVLRGMTICFMIVVNTPGSSPYSYSPLEHSAWHGFTLTDLVFPTFLFVVGNAMSFVMPKWEMQPQSQVMLKIIRRTLLIFLCGYLLYWFPFVRENKEGHWAFMSISRTRIMGVLQRIALCYGIASLLIYFFRLRVSVIIAIVILFLYWFILYHWGNSGDPLSLTGNAVLKLDKWLLGDSHLYHGEGIPFDPEGVLSTLPAIANVIGGYVAGQFVQKKGKTYEGLTLLLLYGFGLLAAGYLWDLGFPINKKIWTSSFVVYTLGLDCVILAFLLYIVEFKKATSWTPFFVSFGKNPLFIYLLSEVGAESIYLWHTGNGVPVHKWVYDHIFTSLGMSFGSMMFSVTFMLLCWLVAYWMDKRRIYIRV
jgi:predicted acyltransferase